MWTCYGGKKKNTCTPIFQIGSGLEDDEEDDDDEDDDDDDSDDDENEEESEEKEEKDGEDVTNDRDKQRFNFYIFCSNLMTLSLKMFSDQCSN